jgi:lysophospholipase L1-like esterase
MTKQKVVLLGASITKGRISYSYEKLLKEGFGKSHQFINHGVAGYESFNVLKNIDKSIRLHPDLVIILVGTNDVMSSLDPKLAKVSRKLKNIPHEPTLVNYSQNMTDIIRLLKDKTHARIALASLPVLGEDLWSDENLRIDQYNQELQRIAQSEKVVYLRANENQKEYLLKRNGGKGPGCTNTTRKAFTALLMHYLLFMSFEKISSKNGFAILTDGIHQNKIGAMIIAEEISRFLSRKENE